MNKQKLITKSVQIITGVTLAEMRQRTRRRPIVDARKLTASILREHTALSLGDIANILHDPNGQYCASSVVMHYINSDNSERDMAYLRYRRDIVARVQRLYKPECTAKEAWSNIWGGVKNNFCLGVVGEQ